jgi:thioredoxin reductase (NADPH)
MAKPALFAIDDEPEVLGAVDRDLRHRYGQEYRVLRSDSGVSALDALKQLKLRGEPVALFLVDQRMPHLTGVQFLEEAIALFPEAKRVLLTAYADTDVAIQAINTIRLDHYLMKPWDPPEERLYPVLDDLLDDWQASFRPPFRGMRVIGHRWSAHTHRLKDFLTRNQIPFKWLELEADDEARSLLETADLTTSQLPALIFEDGSLLIQPTNVQVAEKVGLQTQAGAPFYDLVIVGGGPAGLAAAVYGASEGLSTLLIEKEAPGGQAGMSARIENYLGFPVGLSGGDLARRAVAQARRFGTEILTPLEATGISLQDPYRFVKLNDGRQVACHALLLATGVSYRKLDVNGVDALTGAGVYYGAAMTEAHVFRDRDVFIVGGGNSAGQAALYLSQYARQVTMLIRGETLSFNTSHYLVDQIAQTRNVRVQPHATVLEAVGETELEAVVLACGKDRKRHTLAADALFVFIGAVPHTGWVAGVLARDDQGYILCGPPRPKGWQLDREPYFLETNVPGIFAAGDVRHQSMKRIASAVGEGAMAVYFVHQYLATL